MTTDPYLWLIGALLLGINILLFTILYYQSKSLKHKQHEEFNPSTHLPDATARKSRDYRGIPKHFFGSDAH
jgi:hypothetical protein